MYMNFNEKISEISRDLFKFKDRYDKKLRFLNT